MNISILHVLSIGTYGTDAVYAQSRETFTFLQPWNNVSMWTNVNASCTIPIHADKVNYWTIIKTNMTTTGCKYVAWIILVRVMYDTGTLYKFLGRENVLRFWNIIGSWKTFLHGIIWFTYYYTRKNILILSDKK
jgi:hypothetical protein